LQVCLLITASEWQLIIVFTLPTLKESDCLWHKVVIRQRGNDLMLLDMQPLNPTISIRVTRSACLDEPITLAVFIRNTQNSSRNKVWYHLLELWIVDDVVSATRYSKL